MVFDGRNITFSFQVASSQLGALVSSSPAVECRRYARHLRQARMTISNFLGDSTFAAILTARLPSLPNARNAAKAYAIADDAKSDRDIFYLIRR